MSLVLNEYTGDGVTTTFNFSMVGGYLSREFVVFLTRPNDKLLEYSPYTGIVSWLSDFSVQVSDPIPVGTTFVITRRTAAAALVDFQNTSRITERNLDTAFWQSLHRTAELDDVTARRTEASSRLAAEAVGAAQDAAESAATSVEYTYTAAALVVAASTAAAQSAVFAQEAASHAEAATDTADEAMALIQQAVNGNVASFNGRDGAVLPQQGDYTPDMVGFAHSGVLATVEDFSPVPAWSNPMLNTQAQALANRTELLRDNQKRTPMRFATLSEASAAAATLPDGQKVEVENEQKRYRVEAGALVFEKNLDQLRDDLAQPDGNDPVGGFDTYAKLRAYDGSATRAKVIGSGIEGAFALVSSSDADDGVGLIVDVLGRRWKRLAEGSLNVKASGAVPNSVINNRASIQNVMNWCAENGVTLIVEDVYYVSADATGENVDPFALIVPSGLDMRFIGKGELRQFGAPFNKSSVLLIKDTVKANIWNPVITGTRLTESPSLPEQNHGISILECSDVYIHKPVIRNTMGDGIYIGRTWVGGGLKSPTRVTVFEPVIDRVRRNGISCIAWDDVKIIRPRITNVTNIDGVNAVLPKAGIDIEPEHDSADGAYKDRFKTAGLYIDSPVIDNCKVAAQILLDPKCVGMNIGVHFAGDFRFNASGETGLYPLNLNYIGSGCTGRVKFDSITDASPQTTGADVRAAFAWNYEGGNFPLVIDSLDTRKKTKGTYAMLWFMDADAAKFAAQQGGVSVNMRLSKPVRGALGYRNTPSMNATRKLVHSSFTSEDTENGGYGVENAEYLNTGAIPQGDNCYFDAIRIYAYLPLRGAEWGNRIRLNDAQALQYGKYTLDVRNRLGVFEVLRPWTQTPDAYFIEVVGIATSVSGTPYNAIRSTSRSARAVVRKTEIGVPAEVIETSGEWVAFNAV